MVDGDHPRGMIARGMGTGVHNHGGRLVDVAIPGFAEPVSEVDVFEVHKVGGVESAESFEK